MDKQQADILSIDKLHQSQMKWPRFDHDGLEIVHHEQEGAIIIMSDDEIEVIF